MRQHTELTPKERFYILTRDQYTCQYCGRSAPDVVLHVDHLQPVSLGGTNHPYNLLASCEACNISKSDTPLPESLLYRHQEAIRQRETEMTEDLRVAVVQQYYTSKKTDHLYERPGALLRKHKTRVMEPLKGKTLNPSKRHALRFTIHEEDDVTAEYCRYDPGEGFWQEYPVQLNNERHYHPTVWRPLHEEDVGQLHRDMFFTKTDAYDESHYHIQVAVSDENVILLTLTNTRELTIQRFCFWTPMNNVEIAIALDIPSTEEHMNEEMFWANEETRFDN